MIYRNYELVGCLISALGLRFPFSNVRGLPVDNGWVNGWSFTTRRRKPSCADHLTVNVERAQTGAASQRRTVFFVEVTRLKI